MARNRRPAPPPAPDEDRSERFKNPTSGFLLLATDPQYVGDPEYPQVGETFEDFALRREHEAEVLKEMQEARRARGD